MSNISVLEIKKLAIEYNLAYFRSKLHQNTKILAVVKAFSYGSDSVIVSKVLQKINIDYLAVAYVDEGINLRNNGIDLPIIVLHPQINNFDLLIKYNLEPNIYSYKVLTEFIKVAKIENCVAYPIHLKFNTGLNRLGFLPSDVKNVLFEVKKHKTIKIASVFSHLAASEDLSERDFTQNQINSFEKIKNTVISEINYQPIFHLLNTSGIVNYPSSQYNMVRLGIGLYGFANDKKITNKLKNVLTLKSVISQIHTLNSGDTIGYNRAFKVTTKIRSATIPIGHADGISRKLGNGVGYVLINNKKAKILGNVCMDMIMVDVTHIDCKEGDEVIIFNSQKMIEEISNNLDTIPYELLTMISQRIKRILV
jgi:alanine racemase